MDVADSSVSTLDYSRPASARVPAPPPVLWSDRILQLAERHRFKLFAALLVWYVLGFNGQWRLEPDSALYLTIGRNLAEGHGYSYQGQPHHLAFPGLPLLFALTFKVFHTRSLQPALGMMMLIGLATLALTYRLFLLHAGRPTAVLMTFGLGISRLFYRYNFELLSDLPFLMGVMGFLVGYEAVFYRRQPVRFEGQVTSSVRWFDYVLLVVGLAVALAMRPAMWALLVAIVGALAWSAVRGPVRRPQLLICIAAIALVVLFWRLDPRHGVDHPIGQYEDALIEAKLLHLHALVHQMIHEYVPRLFETTLSQALFGCPVGPGVNTAVGIVILVIGVGLLRQRALWGLWVVMTVVMVLVAVKPLDRYFLEVLPLLVYAWWRAIRWLELRLPRTWGPAALLALFVAGGMTNLSRTGEFIVEQRWRPFLNHYKEGRFASTEQVVKLLRANVKEGQWVLAPPKFARILTFLSRRKVVEPQPARHLDPARQVVFALEPLSDPVRQWLRDADAHPGPQLGNSIQSRYDAEPWRLRRVFPGPARSR